MADNVSQSYANHTRWHAPFHFFLGPGTLLLLILTIVNVVSALISGSTPGFCCSSESCRQCSLLLIRLNPLRAQDRLIRLEERLRLQALLPDAMHSRIPELSERQLVALRFASDAEVAALATQVLASNMPAKDIKKAIVTWRADTFRV